MIKLAATFSIIAAATLPVLADSALKGAIILCLAALIVIAFRRSSASIRHLIWVSALTAALLLPLLSLTLPKWNILPSRAEAPLKITVTGETVADSAGGLITSKFIEVTQEHAKDLSGWEIAAVIWTAGCLLLLGRIAFGGWRLRRLSQSSGPCSDRISAKTVALAESLGISLEVRVLVSKDRTMPMTWGTLRPKILLPAKSEQWDSTCLRSVLLHELAHVKRRDTATQLLVRMACSLHWFNPLVWIAARCIELERERACDDLVLAHGVRASDYAGNLMRIVTQNPRHSSESASLAMARASTLENRLRAILNEGINRRRLTRAMIAMLVGACAVVVLPMAMLGAADDESATLTPKEESNNEPELKGNGSFAGIGITLAMNEDGYPEVLSIIENSAAEDSKLREGDRIEAVRNDAEGEWTELRHMQLAAVVNALRGSAGSKVELRVLKLKGESFDLTLTRKVIQLPEIVEAPVPLEPGNEMLTSIPLQFVDAEVMAESIRKMKLDGVTAIADLRTNKLILKGTAESTAPAIKAARALDTQEKPLKVKTVRILQKDGVVLFVIDGKQITKEKLVPFLKSLEPKVWEAIVEADAATPFAQIAETLGLIEQSGIDAVSLRTAKDIDAAIVNVAIARVEALNMAVNAYIQSKGRKAALAHWAGLKTDQKRYIALSPFLAFAPTELEDYLPDGFTTAFQSNLEKAVKLPLRDSEGNPVNY